MMTDQNTFAFAFGSSGGTSTSPSPHLDSLLSKLRPFQRSAFEFAVHGEKRNSGSRCQRQAVAGAGTGRILLGDEMGLGCVILLHHDKKASNLLPLTAFFCFPLRFIVRST